MKGKCAKCFYCAAEIPVLKIFRMIASLIGQKKSPDINVMIVPGSQQVAAQIVKEGLIRFLRNQDFIRQPGCSACLGMNEDKYRR